MALLRLIPTFCLVLAVTILASFFVSCGDDDDGGPAATPTVGTPAPGSPTTTPTPDANSAAGFRAAMEQLNRELNAGVVDPLIARVKVMEYTCKASDLAPGEGSVTDCKTAGEVIRVVATSNWRSSGSLRLVDAFVANLKGYEAGFDTSKTDTFGSGALQVFALDETKHTAVLTVTSKCLPQHQCPDGFQRLVFVPQFEYAEGRWQMASLMYAFVLGEEFLEADGEGSNIYLPDWERL